MESWWPPYFCILAAQHGAQVTGADLHPAHPAHALHYKHIVADLVPIIYEEKLDKLPGLEGVEFDVITASGLFSSHEFLRSLINSRHDSNEIIRRLQVQAMELLKPGGIYYTDEGMYIK